MDSFFTIAEQYSDFQPANVEETPMSRFLSIPFLIFLALAAASARAQVPAYQPAPPAATPAPSVPPRPTASQLPVRDPHTPGYVKATELPDGTVPPANRRRQFHPRPHPNRAPETTAQPGVPQGTVFEFTMTSADSKIYPGIARDPGTFGTPDPSDPAKLIVPTSHPAP